MELKEYQQETLNQIKSYLVLLDRWRDKNRQVVEAVGNDAELDFPLKAWEELEVNKPYHSRKNGLGKPLPNFCLKIPTGGGKTLLAVKSIDLVNTVYLKRRAGLVLWIVPTNQIYKQTIQNLRNREHPYRQYLDIASGGKTLILEKTDKFSPSDIEENLVILMLMLPSANRQNNETLKLFKDSGGFSDFFPLEDDVEGNKNVLMKIPNLDSYGDENEFWGRQIKTSLGNTLRLLNPIIILDEGHKAYRENAQRTLREFNPSIIIELSATPPDEANKLVEIFGLELNREEMIKLDLHIFNKASPDWKDTLLDTVEKRELLEEKAKEYEANTGNYIRPIALIQVERTGKDQIGGGKIHSEDVREWLTKVKGIPTEQVKVTSAELKEIEGIDLLSKECEIRYIITKQALQEGWDCAFAYMLAVLTNPSSKNSLTQLIGRILRQPFARKTKVKELDESYVICFQQRGVKLLEEIEKGFEDEGLGDLKGRMITDEGFEESEKIQEREIEIRPIFRKYINDVILPVFTFKTEDCWRLINYEMDIESIIKWDKVNLEEIYALNLSTTDTKDTEQIANLSEDIEELIEQKQVIKLRNGNLKLDSVFIARHLLDLVPNPWIAHEIGKIVITKLLEKHGQKTVINNFVFIVEELRKLLLKEKDRLSHEVFSNLLNTDKIRFMVIGKDLKFIKKKMKISSKAYPLHNSDGSALQQSLFEFVDEGSFNEEEKKVAWYLEEQEKLLFWYRNVAKQDYFIQGWKRQKIYPDFIFTSTNNTTKDLDKIFVVETKGIHLKNEDTDYKKSILDLCNQQEIKKGRLDKLFSKDIPVHFEVVFGDEWQKKLNEMLS